MNFEDINTDNITDIEGARKAISQLADCIFVMNRDIQRQLNNLTSQNIKVIDFNITKTQNADTLLKNLSAK